MQKYYYQQGRCEASRYMGLYPVLCESTETKNEYRKVRMVCKGWKDGHATEPTCPMAESCQVFQNTPEIILDQGVALRDKKLGEQLDNGY